MTSQLPAPSQTHGVFGSTHALPSGGVQPFPGSHGQFFGSKSLTHRPGFTASQVPYSSEKHATTLSGGSHFAPGSGKDLQTPVAKTHLCSTHWLAEPPSGTHGVSSGKFTGAHVGYASPSIVRHTPSPELSDVHEASTATPRPAAAATKYFATSPSGNAHAASSGR